MVTPGEPTVKVYSEVIHLVGLAQVHPADAQLPKLVLPSLREEDSYTLGRVERHSPVISPVPERVELALQS